MAGEQAAIELALAEVGGELAPELDLFAPPVSVGGERKLSRLMTERAGPGRPLGARNKRTLRSVEQLLSTHLDPRAKALWIVEQHPADLAALWNCSIYQAAQEQRLWAIGVLPYIAARITPEVLDQHQEIHLHQTLHVAGEAAPAAGMKIVDGVDYQRVEEASDGK